MKTWHESGHTTVLVIGNASPPASEQIQVYSDDQQCVSRLRRCALVSPIPGEARIRSHAYPSPVGGEDEGKGQSSI